MQRIDPIVNARRHIANARIILAEYADEQDGCYEHSGFVKMAARTAFKGILTALRVSSSLGAGKKEVFGGTKSNWN
nr:DUF5618 family protein [uncultured Dyadobacter sp.]